jgi:hypothetical protein
MDARPPQASRRAEAAGAGRGVVRAVAWRAVPCHHHHHHHYTVLAASLRPS